MLAALQTSDLVLTGPHLQALPQSALLASTLIVTWPHFTQVPLNQLPGAGGVVVAPFMQGRRGVPLPLPDITIPNIPAQATLSGQTTATFNVPASTTTGTIQAQLYVGGNPSGGLIAGPSPFSVTAPVGTGLFVQVRSVEYPSVTVDSNNFNVTATP